MPPDQREGRGAASLRWLRFPLFGLLPPALMPPTVLPEALKRVSCLEWPLSLPRPGSRSGVRKPSASKASLFPTVPVSYSRKILTDYHSGKDLGMKKNPGGRPIVPGEKRDKMFCIYLTQTDYAKLKDYALKGGFKSSSALAVAIVEPIIQGGLSLRSAITGVHRIQEFMAKNGVKFGGTVTELGQAVMNLFTPPPPTIPDDVEDLSQLKADLRALLAELENQTKPNPKNQK